MLVLTVLPAAAGELRIRNYYGVAEIVIDGAATEISVEIDSRARLIIEPRIQRVGDNVVVSGRSARPNAQCEERDGKMFVQVDGLNDLRPLEEYPHMTVHAPFGTSLTVIDSMIFGSAGDLDSAAIDLNGCGDFSIGNVSERLNVELEGTGGFSAGDVRYVELSSVGSGQVALGEVEERLRAELSGSGVLEVVAANRNVTLSMSGSGTISVAAGEAQRLTASIRGEGGIIYDGRALTAVLDVNGPGTIRVGSVDGPVRITERGGGSIEIGE